MSTRRRIGASRETRLLVVTIGVSLIVLFVLSRFRFPDAPGPERDAAAQPLARLAARAAFDDLSLAVRELTNRVGGSLLVVGLRVRGDGGRGDGAARLRLVPGLRVRDDAAVVHVPEGAVVDGVSGVPGAPEILARDTVRGLVLVRVPAAQAPVLTLRDDAEPLGAPGYVAVAEAGTGGVALRPVFVGRSDQVVDPRWDPPLFTIGRGAAADQGAPVFTLDGRLAGLLTSTDHEPALIPGRVVLNAVDQLARQAITTNGDVGVATQPVDDGLARATGVAMGAAVAAVAPDGPAAKVLVPGDVITGVNGQPIRTPDALRLRVARTPPGNVLALTVRRDGAFQTLPVAVRARPAAPEAAAGGAPAESPPAERVLGLTLRATPGRGSEVLRVQPRSAADTGDLQPGDVVIGVGRTRTPTPAEIAAAFAALQPGATLFLSVERDGRPRLVALQR